MLSWSPAWRMLRDALFVAGLAAAVAVPYWLARRGTLSFWLEVSLPALAAVVFLAWLLGDVLPLRTVRPRTVFPAGERRASGRRDRP